MAPPRPHVIAVDGPSGSGKSTVAARVASALGWEHLDTGSMYRAVTALVLDAGLAPDDEAGVAALLPTLTLVPSLNGSGTVVVGERRLDEELRSRPVTAAVSAVSAQSAVRAFLTDAQRKIASAAEGLVMEGRDIGSVVMPQAPLKVYLTAREEVRAARRAGQQPATSTADVQADLARRDNADSTRTLSPLTAAADARVVDTSELSADEVVALVLRAWANRDEDPKPPNLDEDATLPNRDEDPKAPNRDEDPKAPNRDEDPKVPSGAAVAADATAGSAATGINLAAGATTGGDAVSAAAESNLPASATTGGDAVSATAPGETVEIETARTEAPDSDHLPVDSAAPTASAPSAAPTRVRADTRRVDSRDFPAYSPRLVTVLKPPARRLFKALWKIEVTGREHVPKTGPVLIVGNHAGALDGPFVVAFTKRPVRILAKIELYMGKMGGFLSRVGQIPVDRGRPDRVALHAGIDVLKGGGILGIFPEGTRAGSGEVRDVRGGAAYLALHAPCTIIPVVCTGTSEAFPKGARRPIRNVPIFIDFGAPIDIHVDGDPRARSSVATATAQIRTGMTNHLEEVRRRRGTS